jgi:glycine/D-amino acid oxidase-like deaminating enzyme
MTGRIEVAVVGGGAVGLCTALALREAGAGVTVFEREVGGENASFGNAGVVSPFSVTPLSMPGSWKSIPRWLLDPLGPIFLRPAHALRFLPWAARYVANGREAVVRRIAEGMHTLNHDNVALYRHWLAGTGHEDLLVDSCYVCATRDPAGASLDTLDADLKRQYGARLRAGGGRGVAAHRAGALEGFQGGDGHPRAGPRALAGPHQRRAARPAARATAARSSRPRLARCGAKRTAVGGSRRRPARISPTAWRSRRASGRKSCWPIWA